MLIINIIQKIKKMNIPTELLAQYIDEILEETKNDGENIREIMEAEIDEEPEQIQLQPRSYAAFSYTWSNSASRVSP